MNTSASTLSTSMRKYAAPVAGLVLAGVALLVLQNLVLALAGVVVGFGVPVVESGRISLSLPLFILCGAGVVTAAWSGNLILLIGAILLSAILLSTDYLRR